MEPQETPTFRGEVEEERPVKETKEQTGGSGEWGCGNQGRGEFQGGSAAIESREKC